VFNLEEEIGKVCYLCGKKIQDNEKYVEDWLRHYHISCLCEWARKKRFYEESIELTKRIMDELNSKQATAIDNNLIIYKKGEEIFLKVTDYTKGYWAEVPLKKEKLLAFFTFLKINSNRSINKKLFDEKEIIYLEAEKGYFITPAGLEAIKHFMDCVLVHILLKIEEELKKRKTIVIDNNIVYEIAKKYSLVKF